MTWSVQIVSGLSLIELHANLCPYPQDMSFPNTRLLSGPQNMEGNEENLSATLLYLHSCSFTYEHNTMPSFR